MQYCSNCLMPSSRPRVIFHNGICNACLLDSENKNNQQLKDNRKIEFQNLLKEIKNTNHRNDNYDCIVPWSGGKDSSYVALKLKDEYGLRPLLVTFNPLIPTAVGNHNRSELIKYGFDSLFINTNREIISKLSRRFLIERGNPKLHWDAGVNASIFRMALNLKIPYIFYAEHGESTYGGRVLKDDSIKLRDYEEVIENQIGDYPENWENGSDITSIDLIPYVMPPNEKLVKNSIKAFYFGYFDDWNVVNNFKHVSSKIDFKTHPEGRTCGTNTDFDSLDDYMDDIYYYFQYIKFGFGRSIRDLSRQIQFGEITRDKAIEIAERYDGEFPHASLPYALEFLQMSDHEFYEVVDNHRPSNIWEKKENNWSHLHSYKLFRKNSL